MKKLYGLTLQEIIATLLFVFCMCACPAYSQTLRVCRLPKHEISISTGMGQIQPPKNHFSSCAVKKNLNYQGLCYCDEDLGDSWNLNLSYMYNPSGRFGVGLQVGMSKDYGYSVLRSHYYYMSTLASCRYDCYFVMPSVRMYWYSNKYYGIYSRVAGGMGFRQLNETDECPNDDMEFGSDSGCSRTFEYQVSPLCIDAYYRHLGAFFEFGFGIQGVATLGIKYGF